MKNNAWMLPEGIDEAGPEQARAIEVLRRQCIDRMQRWGYQLIMPPMVEFTESLLTGAGAELELQTLKVIDQLSGRLMGIRADMTPQAARLDARSGQGINRLSYCGSTCKLALRVRVTLARRFKLVRNCLVIRVWMQT